MRLEKFKNVWDIIVFFTSVPIILVFTFGIILMRIDGLSRYVVSLVVMGAVGITSIEYIVGFIVSSIIKERKAKEKNIKEYSEQYAKIINRADTTSNPCGVVKKKQIDILKYIKNFADHQKVIIRISTASPYMVDSVTMFMQSKEERLDKPGLCATYQLNGDKPLAQYLHGFYAAYVEHNQSQETREGVNVDHKAGHTQLVCSSKDCNNVLKHDDANWDSIQWCELTKAFLCVVCCNETHSHASINMCCECRVFDDVDYTKEEGSECGKKEEQEDKEKYWNNVYATMGIGDLARESKHNRTCCVCACSVAPSEKDYTEFRFCSSKDSTICRSCCDRICNLIDDRECQDCTVFNKAATPKTTKERKTSVGGRVNE